MKAKFFLSLLLSVTLTIGVSAQSKLRNSDIPQEVRMGLENTYADFKLNEWSFETGQYVASISIDNQMGKSYFASNGDWQFTIFEIPERQVPTLVMNYFVNSYPGYRIKRSEYVEERSGDNYYRLLISMKGIAQTEYELLFDPRGNLIKSNAPDPKHVKKDYIARQNPEDIERQTLKAAEKDLELSDPEAAGKGKKRKGKKVDISTVEIEEKVKPSEEVEKSFKKKFQRANDVEWTKDDDDNFIASFTNRQGNKLDAKYKPDGMLVSLSTHLAKERFPRAIQKDLDKRYPKCRIEQVLKTEWDRKYALTITDRKLKTFYFVEISTRVKGRKERRIVKMTYDNNYRFEGLSGDDGEFDE